MGMRVPPLRAITWLLCAFTTACALVAVSGNGWLIKGTVSWIGLFNECTQSPTTGCLSLSSKAGVVGDQLRTVRAFIIIAAMASPAALLLVTFNMFYRSLGRATASVILYVIAAIGALIGTAVYADNWQGFPLGTGYSTGWAYGFSWAVFPLSLMSAVLLRLDRGED
jgi:hypothetical protein